jgi:hypothetical protein
MIRCGCSVAIAGFASGRCYLIVPFNYESHPIYAIEFMTTSNLELLKSKIESLPDKEFFRLSHWFAEKEWERWDRQLEVDEAASKLDVLVAEARSQGSAHNL